MNSFRLLLTIFLISLLPACGTTGPDTDGALLPMPEEAFREPDDAALKVAVTQYLQEIKAPASSLYDFDRIDLNGDQRRDALVLFKNPYGYWCNGNGCPMLVFSANNNDFSFVNAVDDIRGPVYISTEQTNGWHDIMVRISGRWTETKDVAMQYDGAAYPVRPDTLPAYDQLAQNTAQKIFR